MMKKFWIYATKIKYETDEEKEENNYTLDHTVISYLMNNENEYLDHLGSSLSAKDLSEKVWKNINED